MSVIAFPVLSQLVRRRCNYYLVAFSVSYVLKLLFSFLRDIMSQ
jgi:hypothetical protein